MSSARLSGSTPISCSPSLMSWLDAPLERSEPERALVLSTGCELPHAVRGSSMQFIARHVYGARHPLEHPDRINEGVAAWLAKHPWTAAAIVAHAHVPRTWLADMTFPTGLLRAHLGCPHDPLGRTLVERARSLISSAPAWPLGGQLAGRHSHHGLGSDRSCKFCSADDAILPRGSLR